MHPLFAGADSPKQANLAYPWRSLGTPAEKDFKRLRTAVSIVGLLALPAALAGPAAADHKPGHNPGGATSLSIAAKPTAVVFGSATVLSGRLTGANKAGVTVALREDPFPFGDGAKPVATAVTDAQGDYSFTRRPLVNTSFGASAGPTRSPNMVVNVRIRMSMRVSDSTPRVGQVVRFKGRACPTHNGLVSRSSAVRAPAAT